MSNVKFTASRVAGRNIFTVNCYTEPRSSPYSANRNAPHARLIGKNTNRGYKSRAEGKLFISSSSVLKKTQKKENNVKRPYLNFRR